MLAAVASVAVPPLAGQSLLYRAPNAGGTWVPAAGVLQFNFLHRFEVASSAGGHKVTNYPTFTFALGLGHGLTLGTHYATSSQVAATFRPNEFELYGRVRLGAAEGANGLAIAITPAYNAAARSLDGEVGVDYTAGRVTLSVAGRGVQKPFGLSGGKAAASAGATLRLNDYISIGGDIGAFFDLDTAPAWSAGINFVIPGSPHTFSLHASNSTSSTIQGSSFAFGDVRYGFEFTIPIRFSRFAPWFAKARKGYELVDGPMMNAAATVSMKDMKFLQDSIEIRAGQSVRWVNNDFVDHTVTFEQPGPTSSGMVRTNGAFVAKFDQPGTYRYHCTPHPDMTGVVVVK
jgi:plastocyanin